MSKGAYLPPQAEKVNRLAALAVGCEIRPGIACPTVIQRQLEHLDAAGQHLAGLGGILWPHRHAQRLELGNRQGHLGIVALGRHYIRPNLGPAGPHHPTALVRRIFGRHPVAKRFGAGGKTGGMVAGQGILIIFGLDGRI